MQIIQGSGKKVKQTLLCCFHHLEPKRALMVNLTKKLTEKNHKTMVFNNSHLNSELLAMQAKKQKST